MLAPKKTIDNVIAPNQKRVFLHASSVSISNEAILFLGHSTAGKSTISAILSERFPLIADDKVLVYKSNNGCWMVRGVIGRFSAWTGKGCMVDEKVYPLAAILRIFKSSTVKIIPISSKDTCKYLVDAVFENEFQKNHDGIELTKSWFNMAAEISRKINGWSLTFPKNKTIIEKIDDIFKSK